MSLAIYPNLSVPNLPQPPAPVPEFFNFTIPGPMYEFPPLVPTMFAINLDPIPPPPPAPPVPSWQYLGLHYGLPLPDSVADYPFISLDMGSAPITTLFRRSLQWKISMREDPSGML